MFSLEARAILTTVTHGTKCSQSRQCPKIGTLFFVALAVRKFQRFESNKFKRFLEYIFDKDAALLQLYCLFESDAEFFQMEFVKLAYFIRKFSLNYEDFRSFERKDLHGATFVENLYYCLVHGCSDSSSEQNEQKLYFLCLSLKYLTRNSRSNPPIIKISLILELIERCKIYIVKTELVALTVSLVENLPEPLYANDAAKLEDLVQNLSDVGQEVKALLLSTIHTNKAIGQLASGLEESCEDITPTKAIRSVKKNQQVVTKTIQSVESKQDAKNSEETDFKFLNLSDALRSKSRRSNINAVFENVDTVADNEGSDRSMFSSTWAEVVNLYSLMFQNQPIKVDDKDNFLPDKFLGVHYYFDKIWSKDAKPMYSFLINAMCASIFASISKKQQLSDKALYKLLKCASSFDGLISVLKLKSDFVDMFVVCVYERYWDLKKIDHPDIIVDFIGSIMDKTTEQYVSVGWVWNSPCVRKKSFDRAEVENLIVDKLNKVRHDSIHAIYNCALRDKEILNPGRVKCIKACLAIDDKKNHSDPKFKSYVFKLIELAESREDFDYTEIFQSYISQLQCINGESIENLTAMLRFIHNQAKDGNRCKSLFNNHVLTILIAHLGSESQLCSKLKLNIVQIINTYLLNDLKGMSEENLQLLLQKTLQSNDATLLDLALTSCLILADTPKSLPRNFLTLLMMHLDHLCYSEYACNYIVFILNRAVCGDNSPVECRLFESNDIEKISNYLQCDQVVCVNDSDFEDGPRVKFEKLMEKNRYCASNLLSLLTAKIILKSAENKMKLTAVTVDNLLLTLNGTSDDDKQTRIVTAKCLYVASKYMSFSSGDLSQMLDCINSPVYDVSVYSHATYLSGCVKLAFASDKCLDPIHLDNISSLYVDESLKLGLHDYASEINKNLFRILLYEAKKQEFKDQNLFPLLDCILYLNGQFASQVLGILAVYTSSGKFVLPQPTIIALENMLGIPAHFEKALLVLQNLILGSLCFVSSKTLETFIDYIYMSVNSRLRFYAFKLLEKVRGQQEVADDIFYKVELAKAGYALEHEAHATKKLKIIEFIQILTGRGMPLPLDTQFALEKEASCTDVLKVLANMSRTGRSFDLSY